jgi:NADH-quinone oxidoreductase subunit A
MDLSPEIIILSAFENVRLWPSLAYAATVLLLAGGMVGLSYILGERHRDKSTNEIYESGIRVTGDARVRFSSHFYLVAMFFVIFDLEAAFIVGWAVAFEQVAWVGFIGAATFIGVLFVVLIYEWKIGALDFGPNSKKILEVYHEKNKKSKIVEQVKKAETAGNTS